MPAGTLVYLGEKQEGHPKARITAIAYDGEHFDEREVSRVSDLLPLKPAPAVTWINVDGLHDVSALADFGEAFQLHPLLLEDILNTDQRPKAEYLENTAYVILKFFDYEPVKNELLTEQVSLVLGENYLISFQEETGDEFDGVRERLRQNSLRIRKAGADYLAYTLIDTVVDRYFNVLEKVGETLDALEEDLMSRRKGQLLSSIHHLRRELIYLRKYVWPVREVLNSLQHAETPLFTGKTRLYLRDVYEHTVQVMDTLETYRDLLGGVQDLYLSLTSNRLNEIMKVLTVISTIFIPLTFIVGVYGMNFRYMPELDSPWGYPAVWLVMLLAAGGMVFYFKKQRWF